MGPRRRSAFELTVAEALVELPGIEGRLADRFGLRARRQEYQKSGKQTGKAPCPAICHVTGGTRVFQMRARPPPRRSEVHEV